MPTPLTTVHIVYILYISNVYSSITRSTHKWKFTYPTADRSRSTRRSRAQIKQQILSGQLHEGDALPSIRLLAKELRISVITTKRAY